MKSVYFHGKILTMEPGPAPEALLAEDGVITAMGPKEEIFEQADAHTVFVDLEEHALLPAFLDAHSHITALSKTIGLADLSACASFDDLVKTLSAFEKRSPGGPNEPLIGFGYDHTRLREGRHPDRHVLDRVSEARPVLAANASGHMGAANTPMLALLGIRADTPDPEGGRIGRERDGTPDGYLEETAFTGLAASAAAFDTERGVKCLRYAEKEYFRYGVTTVQDGLTRREDWKLLKSAAERGLLRADVVCYPDALLCPDVVEEEEAFRSYRGRLRIGGYKLILDGSPQGRTAWLSAPYEGETEYRGYPVHTDAEVVSAFLRAIQNRRQILVHCNGDAAVQQMLDCLAEARRRAGTDGGIRPVMIHAQLLRPDQMDQLKALGVMPSFFSAHTWFWGDTHLKNLGSRALGISPAGSARARGIPFTLHQDTPVLPPDMLRTVRCAVTRKTRGGADLAAAERITVLDALRAVTKNAAWQYGEEDSKGSLQVGKRADFVILERDPLEVPAEELADVRVLATFKDGERVWKPND